MIPKQLMWHQRVLNLRRKVHLRVFAKLDTDRRAVSFLAESDFLACEQTAVATLFIYKRSKTLSRRMLSVSQLWLWSILLLWAWQTAQGLQLISTQIKRTSDWQRAFEGEGWFRSCCRCDVITKLIYLDADCLEILICLVKTFPFYHIMLKLWALN